MDSENLSAFYFFLFFLIQFYLVYYFKTPKIETILEINFRNIIFCGFDLALAHTLYCKRFVRLRIF
jgi:hypothetical protein